MRNYYLTIKQHYLKCLIIVVTLTAFGIEANSQKLKVGSVPAPVKAKLASMYPKAKAVKWEMEEGKYEAEFMHNQVETSVLFHQEGEYDQTEVEIPVSTVPKKILIYASVNMGGKRIKEASKISNAKNVITFEVEIGGKDYMFDANGNFLKKE
jgi:hypothetical protein